MFRFRMEIAGEVAIDRGIARFSEGIADYRPVWPLIADDFYSQIGRQFKTEGTAGGDGWQELSPEYAEWKEAHYPGKPILQRTGDLIESLTNPNSPHAVMVAERKSLTLGSSLDYAVYHQKGTSKMPARPEIQLTEGFKRTTMAHMQGYMVQIATQSGFRLGRTPGSMLPPSWRTGADWRRAMGVGF